MAIEKMMLKEPVRITISWGHGDDKAIFWPNPGARGLCRMTFKNGGGAHEPGQTRFDLEGVGAPEWAKELAELAAFKMAAY